MDEKMFTVDRAVKAFYEGEVSTEFTVTLLDGSVYTLMNSFMLYSHLSMMYGCYYFLQPDFLPLNVDNLRTVFLQWLQRNNDNIARAIDALTRQYNPINNYDMTEQSADGSRQAKVTGTVTPSGSMQDTAVHTGTDTTTDNRYGLDSTTGKPADQTSLQHGETVTSTTTFTGYETETVTESDNDKSMQLPDGTTATGYDRANEHYMTRSGNIGVTTSAQMITGELELRVHDLAIEWLRRFADEYLIYWG